MNPKSLAALAVGACLAGCPAPAPSGRPTAPPPPGFHRPDPARHPDLFLWTDTCNVWILRDGENALLVDLGDGSVLDRLGEIGVRNVEWVLFTHHHREQLQGAPRLRGRDARVAGPEAERALFEQPARFRRMNVRLGDPYTVHGASYVRPPVEPVPLDRGLRRMDTFAWRGREFWCLETRGHSPGALSYLLRENGRWLAFSGDVMLEGARLHTWFDSEWDYGFAAGIHALAGSAALLEGFAPAWLLPSHGEPLPDPGPLLAEFQRKLRRLERLLVRGYDVHTFSATHQDRVSRPTAVPHLWQVLPHLYKLRGPNFFPNFNLILSDRGRALLSDCGLLDEAFLDRTIEDMRRKLGLKAIDAVVVSHMHGDHFLQAPYLRKNHGARIWALDRMGPVCERPEHFDYAAPIQAYGQKLDGQPIERVSFDRLFRDGESFEWEGFRFTVDWMPGQTEFALALRGTIDGKTVVFTGDNIFGDPDNPDHTGHEAVVARNSSILEEGYILGAEYLSRTKPDLLVGGHSFVMDRPAGLIERYRRWSYAMRDAFREILEGDDYRYAYDPFWVRAEPYRIRLRPGESAEIALHVRNFRTRPQRHLIAPQAPPGLIVEPPILEGEIPPESRRAFPMRLGAAPDSPAGVRIVAFDVTLDGRRYGQWFDAVVEVRP